MRLINADELIEKAWDADNGFGWEKVVSVHHILNASTIDLVQCKDCIHAKEMTQYGCDECVYYCKKLKIVTSSNWFCAEGKREK